MVPELKLDSNVAIGSGLIDAHAGALGILNSQVLSMYIGWEEIKIGNLAKC